MSYSDSVSKYRLRRYIRLLSRMDCKENSEKALTNRMRYGIINMDANNALAFALCKENGIDLPSDATPGDAWEALKGKGITPGNAYKSLRSSGGESEKKSSGTDKPKAAGASKAPALTDDQVKAKFKTGDAKTFGDQLRSAQANVAKVAPESAWRVAGSDYTPEDYATFKNFQSDGGSVASVKPDGDIVSVCKDPTDKTVSGKDILRNAVLNGGTKLDSFSGNHGFYLKCGFEPVAWCDFDDEYAPDDWLKQNGIEPGDTSWYGKPDDELILPREPIIFYRYTGKVSTESAHDFVNRVRASDDYFAAEEARDNAIKEAKGE